ncbi:MAG: YtxH domain-containing protein [Candidatus Cyclobacteriaceae bacterium M3_2C_046]
MKNTSKVILALLTGAAAGSIVGLLMAPESGDKSRKKLMKNAKKLNQDIKANLEEVSVKGQAALKEVSDSLQDYKKLAEEKVSKAVHN